MMSFDNNQDAQQAFAQIFSNNSAFLQLATYIHQTYSDYILHNLRGPSSTPKTFNDLIQSWRHAEQIISSKATATNSLTATPPSKRLAFSSPHGSGDTPISYPSQNATLNVQNIPNILQNASPLQVPVIDNEPMPKSQNFGLSMATAEGPQTTGLNDLSVKSEIDMNADKFGKELLSLLRGAGSGNEGNSDSQDKKDTILDVCKLSSSLQMDDGSNGGDTKNGLDFAESLIPNSLLEGSMDETSLGVTLGNSFNFDSDGFQAALLSGLPTMQNLVPSGLNLGGSPAHNKRQKIRRPRDEKTCAYCGQRFAIRDEQRKHAKTCEQRNNPIKWIRCPFYGKTNDDQQDPHPECAERFKPYQQDLLEKHLADMHPGHENEQPSYVYGAHTGRGQLCEPATREPGTQETNDAPLIANFPLDQDLSLPTIPTASTHQSPTQPHDPTRPPPLPARKMDFSNFPLPRAQPIPPSRAIPIGQPVTIPLAGGNGILPITTDTSELARQACALQPPGAAQQQRALTSPGSAGFPISRGSPGAGSSSGGGGGSFGQAPPVVLPKAPIPRSSQNVVTSIANSMGQP